MASETTIGKETKSRRAVETSKTFFDQVKGYVKYQGVALIAQYLISNGYWAMDRFNPMKKGEAYLKGAGTVALADFGYRTVARGEPMNEAAGAALRDALVRSSLIAAGEFFTSSWKLYMAESQQHANATATWEASHPSATPMPTETATQIPTSTPTATEIIPTYTPTEVLPTPTATQNALEVANNQLATAYANETAQAINNAQATQQAINLQAAGQTVSEVVNDDRGIVGIGTGILAGIAGTLGISQMINRFRNNKK